MIDILFFLVVFFILGEILIIYFCKLHGYGRKHRIFTLALLFRIVITWYYYYRTLIEGGDAYGYYIYATQNSLSNFSVLFSFRSTDFINNLATVFYFPFSFLNNSYLALYIPFSLIGFIGSLLYYRIFKSLAPNSNKLCFVMAFFLPSIIFWTCNIGKDSIIYFAIAGLLYPIVLNKEKKFKILNIITVILCGALTYYVRPHVLIALTISLVLSYFLEKGSFSFRKILIFIVALLALVFLLRRVLDFIGLGEAAETASVSSYYGEGVEKVEDMATRAASGGSKLPRSGPIFVGMTPLYGFYWLVTPFFWQAVKLSHLFGVIDGLLYQFLIVYILIHWKVLVKINSPPYKYCWILYIIITSSIFGMWQTNFGLAVRQRVMVVPFIIMLYVAISNEVYQRRLMLRKSIS